MLIDHPDTPNGMSQGHVDDHARLFHASFARLVFLKMKPTESRVYSYLIYKCLLEPTIEAEPSCFRTIDRDTGTIARDIGSDRPCVDRAIDALISMGYADVSERGRIWPADDQSRESDRRRGY